MLSNTRDTAMSLYLKQAENEQRLRLEYRQQTANNLADYANRHGWTGDDLTEIAQILGISDLLPAPTPALPPGTFRRPSREGQVRRAARAQQPSPDGDTPG